MPYLPVQEWTHHLSRLLQGSQVVSEMQRLSVKARHQKHPGMVARLSNGGGAFLNQSVFHLTTDFKAHLHQPDICPDIHLSKALRLMCSWWIDVGRLQDISTDIQRSRNLAREVSAPQVGEVGSSWSTCGFIHGISDGYQPLLRDPLHVSDSDSVYDSAFDFMNDLHTKGDFLSNSNYNRLSNEKIDCNLSCQPPGLVHEVILGILHTIVRVDQWCLF